MDWKSDLEGIDWDELSNLYRIAPLGENRVAFVSAEHTFKFFTPFYDLGSVWNAGQPVVFHQSVGVRIFKIPVDQDALLLAMKRGQTEVHRAWQDVK